MYCFLHHFILFNLFSISIYFLLFFVYHFIFLNLFSISFFPCLLCAVRSYRRHPHFAESSLILALAYSFANFLAISLSVDPCSLPFSSRSASVNPYLETLDQPPRSFVDMANRNESFSDFSKKKKTRQGKIAFLSFPYG